MSGTESLSAARESVSAWTLTEAQKRHLRELVNERGETRYWRPANAGEWRCARKLAVLGLLDGSAISRGSAYYLSDLGLRLARGLVANPDV